MGGFIEANVIAIPDLAAVVNKCLLVINSVSPEVLRWAISLIANLCGSLGGSVLSRFFHMLLKLLGIICQKFRGNLTGFINRVLVAVIFEASKCL